MEDELTVQDVAKIINVTEHSVTNWANAGLLVGCKKGIGPRKRWFFNRSAVTAFLEEKGRKPMKRADEALEARIDKLAEDQETLRQAQERIAEKLTQLADRINDALEVSRKGGVHDTRSE